MQIIVNGSAFDVQEAFLTYDDITLLAGKPGDQSLTITYTTPPVDNRGLSGTLRPGRSIEAEHNMVFDAVNTGAA